MSEFTKITDFVAEIKAIPAEAVAAANAAFAELQKKHPRRARRQGFLRTQFIKVFVQRELERLNVKLTDEQCDKFIEMFERLIDKLLEG